MAWSDWSERQRLAVTGGVVGGGLAITVGLVAYAYMVLSDLEKEIGGLRANVKRLEKEADKLDERKKVLDQLKLVRARDERRLPDDDGVLDLFSQISEQAQNARVEVMNIAEVKEKVVRKKRTKRSRAKYTPVKMRLKCKAAFHDFGKFLYRLESKLDRIMAVTSFDLDAYKSGLIPDKAEITVELKFEAYRYGSR